MKPRLPSSRLVVSAVKSHHRHDLPLSIINQPIASSLAARPPLPQPTSPTPGDRRPFMSSSSPRQPAPQQPPGGMSWEEVQEKWDDLSSEAKIQAVGDEKWGWVVYRCAYAEELDARWDAIKRQIVRDLHEEIARSDAPGIADTMDFVFVEDPALEGASVPQLQHRFQAWARASDGYNYVEGSNTSRGSRYEFFVMVDADAFRNRYVGLVRGWPMEKGLEEENHEEDEDEGGAEDWVRLSAYRSVTTELYEELNNPESWYTIYYPPEMGEASI